MKIICIDPGHGGADNGASYGSVDEDNINLEIGFMLRFLLQKNGFEIYMTRDKDVYIPLADRCTFANQVCADMFVSIHCDAWHSETTKGISTHIYRNAGTKTTKIAESIHNALIGRFKDHTNRGLKKSGFYVLKNTSMPAVLIECEFISNPEMRNFLANPENQFALAYAITNGLKPFKQGV